MKFISKINKIFLPRFFYIAIFPLLFINCSFAEISSKKVLIINSYHYGHIWTDNVLKGIKDVFSSSDLKIEYYSTFMDFKRIPYSDEYIAKFKEYIHEKFKSIKLDVIIANDNDALNFLIKFRDELFSGVPVVFSGINNFDVSMLNGKTDITGLPENTNYIDTIKIALKLRPHAKGVVVVVDNTTTGKVHKNAIQKIEYIFSNKVSFKYLSADEHSFEELAQKLSELKNDSVVLLLQHYMDKNGNTQSIEEGTPFLTSECNVPCFAVTDIRVGFGVIGGCVVSGYHYGKEAALMAIDILHGKEVGKIPVRSGPSLNLFDYKAMMRFNVSENTLPNERMILNKPASIIEQYKREIIGIAVILSLLLIVIIIMTLEVRNRRKVEKALHRSEERLKEAQSIALLGNWEYDVVEDKLWWSDEVYKIFEIDHYSNQASINLFISRVHEEDKAELKKQIDSGLPHRSNYRIVLPNKKTKHLHEEVKCEYDKNNHIIRSWGTVQDVTRLEQIQDALRKSEEQFRNITYYSPFAVYTYQLDSNNEIILTGANPAADKTIGINHDELIGKTLVEAFPNFKNTEVPEMYKKVAKGEIGNQSFEISYKDERFSGFYEVRVFKTSENKIAVKFIDITDRKKRDEEKIRLQTQIAHMQKIESIARLAGGIAHDINNYLTPIIGYTDLLLDQISDKDEMYKIIKGIQDPAIAAKDLTLHLLTFGRKQIFHMKVQSLNDIVIKKKNLISSIVRENIELSFALTEKNNNIYADSTQIEQIIINIITNGVESISGTGKIKLSTDIVEINAQEVKHKINAAIGKYVKLQVQDTGCGMDEKTKEHLFEPFFTTKDLKSKFGLGLSSVFGIVNQHNGFIEVISEKNKGSIFQIYFPLSDKNAEKDAVNDTLLNNPDKNKLILIVDDNKQMRDVTSDMLITKGYRVLVADSPTGALHLAEKYGNEIHLLLSDVIMPEMNGKELYAKIHNLYPHIRALFMSGYSDDILSKEGILKEGINYISKPFQVKTLESKIMEALISTSKCCND